jgi:3-oxoacyl-[acyl-carrier-protein] synthase II
VLLVGTATSVQGYDVDTNADVLHVDCADSVASLAAGVVPATRNYRTPDPACPVNVVQGEPLAGRPATAIAVNLCSTGQAVAVVVAAA